MQMQKYYVSILKEIKVKLHIQRLYRDWKFYNIFIKKIFQNLQKYQKNFKNIQILLYM